MANDLFDKAARLMVTAGLNWTTDTIKAALIDTNGTNAYVVNLAGHEYLSAIPPAAIKATVELTGKTVQPNGAVDADDAIFPLVPVGPAIEALVIYKDTGNPATSPLLAWFDTVTGLPVIPVGQDITAIWDGGINRIFRP